jgi:hypothetical protein
MSKHYVGESGTILRFNTRIDLTALLPGSSPSVSASPSTSASPSEAASALQIKFKKPDGTQGSWDAEIYNTTYLQYTLKDNDIDQAGTWEFQAYVDSDSWTGLGESVSVEFYDKFDEIKAIPAVTLAKGTNSFCTLAEAEAYLTSRFGASEHWKEGVDKVAALITAYNYLKGSGIFNFPDAVADITTAMIQAQCEMALFLIQHLSDMDARKGLQAQGVSAAGIVKETYDLEKAAELPMPPIVFSLLADCRADEDNLFQADLNRDEED